MSENKIIIAKVLRRVRPYWGRLILSLMLALLYVAMSLYIPILVGDAIDGIRETGVDGIAISFGYPYTPDEISGNATVSH